MTTILVEGGEPLKGNVDISGSKNSALKLIAAALLCNDDVVLENVPKIENVESDLEIVTALGGTYTWEGKNRLIINGSGINTYEIPFNLGSQHRTASLYAAALVFRFGKAVIPFPGGCKIGARPINRWVDVWESLGIKVTNDEKNVYLDGENLEPGMINFSKSSHMGTDMAILFSSFVPGETVINNAAEEPEIDDLIEFMNLIGVSVERTDHRKIRVEGTKQFSSSNFKVQSDRNEVVTFAIAALVTNGNITISGVNRAHLLAFLNVLTKLGAKFEINDDEMRIWSREEEKLEAIDVTTSHYPGFMTDWQPLITLLATQLNGESLIHDTIYWDRFGYTVDLNRMGAKIELVSPSELGLETVINEDTYDLKKLGEPKTVAKVSGPKMLKGAKLHIPDLRAGASLVLAALSAEGKSEIVGFENVTRGYENFIQKLTNLGAKITSL